jgi:hypothetical protein
VVGVWLGALITGIEILHAHHSTRDVRLAYYLLWFLREETLLFPAGVLTGVARGPRGGKALRTQPTRPESSGVPALLVEKGIAVPNAAYSGLSGNNVL